MSDRRLIRSTAGANRRVQQGVALVVVLLLLVIVTVLGLAAMRGSLLQERMSGNLAARSVAFQAAEAVLRVGEAYAAGKPSLPAAGSGCSAGLCGMPVDGAAPAWQASGFWNNSGNFRSPSTSEVPRPNGSIAGYVVEDMGTGEDVSGNCTTSIDMTSSPCSSTVQRYRVTAYVRLSNGAETTLQSRYQVQ